MKLTEKTRIFNKAYKTYIEIDCMEDLNKNKLSLSDYDNLRNVLEKLSNITDRAKALTLSKNVANWCKKMNFTVVEKNVNFEISL